MGLWVLGCFNVYVELLIGSNGRKLPRTIELNPYQNKIIISSVLR